jgi:hypothetical protein
MAALVIGKQRYDFGPPRHLPPGCRLFAGHSYAPRTHNVPSTSSTSTNVYDSEPIFS